MGGHRGDGQARDGVDLVLLLSLVGWVCSSSAQKEGKKAAATLTVSSLDTPSSAPMKSWLVVARSASARVRLVGHLGWVHRQEARPVGEPHERMGGRRERRTTGRDLAVFARKTRGAKGVGPDRCLHRGGGCTRSEPRPLGAKCSVTLAREGDTMGNPRFLVTRSPNGRGLSPIGTGQHQICLVRPFLRRKAIFFWVLWAP